MGKYLVVEDDPIKYKEIEVELVTLGVSNDDIIHVSYINAATQYLKSNVCFMLLLDLNLPMVKNGTCIELGGVTLLSKLNGNPEKYNLPEFIFGLTAYNYLLRTQKENFESLCFNLFDFERDDWRFALRNRIHWRMHTERNREKKSEKRIVYSVHGIRTLGKWQNILESNISSSSLNYEIVKHSYNYFSAIHLLLPIFRKKVIKRISKELKTLSDSNPDARVSIFCHSFGTYAVLKALEELPISTELAVENLVLAGSVVKSDYDFSPLKHRFGISKVVNECGYNDNTLLLSHYFCVDLGMAGRIGFIGSGVINRFHQGGHDFFYKDLDFMKKNWLPLLNGDEILPIDDRNFSFIRENLEIVIGARISFLVILLLVILFISIFF